MKIGSLRSSTLRRLALGAVVLWCKGPVYGISTPLIDLLTELVAPQFTTKRGVVHFRWCLAALGSALYMAWIIRSLSIHEDIMCRGFGAYGILGVPVDASPGVIGSHYRQMTRQLHPDKLSKFPEKQREAQEKAYDLMLRAYEVLRDSVLRKLYDSYGLALSRGPPVQQGMVLDIVMQKFSSLASRYFSVGLYEIAHLVWGNAVSFTTSAVKLVLIAGFALLELYSAATQLPIAGLPAFQGVIIFRGLLQVAMLAVDAWYLPIPDIRYQFNSGASIELSQSQDHQLTKSDPEEPLKDQS